MCYDLTCPWAALGLSGQTSAKVGHAWRQPGKSRFAGTLTLLGFWENLPRSIRQERHGNVGCFLDSQSEKRESEH